MSTRRKVNLPDGWKALEWILLLILIALVVLAGWILLHPQGDKLPADAVETTTTTAPEGTTTDTAYMVGKDSPREFRAFTVVHKGLAYDCITVEAANLAMQCFPVTGGR